MHHLAPTGQSGFGAYAGAPGREAYAGTSIFDQRADSIASPSSAA